MIKKILTKIVASLKDGQFVASIDNNPWEHPFLTFDNISNFRKYSEEIWKFSRDYEIKNSNSFDAFFYMNMAQNMYKWATLAQKYGIGSKLVLHPHDKFVFSSPYCEEFDGEFESLENSLEALESNPSLSIKVPVLKPSMYDLGISDALNSFKRGENNQFLEIIHKNPTIKYEVLFQYYAHYPTFEIASVLSKSDVIYAASTPFAAYASGKPYCAFSVGGDLQFDCGRNDDYGLAMKIAFACAKFLLISNPHSLGHSRRLGFTNGVYLPYPMDTDKYCPGKSASREKWNNQFGDGFYILMTSRIDKDAKGQDDNFINTLLESIKEDTTITVSYTHLRRRRCAEKETATRS